MDFKTYVQKLNDFSRELEDKGLEIYKQGGRHGGGHGYIFLLPKKDLIEGKRIISEEEKVLLANIFPERFSKEYMEKEIRAENEKESIYFKKSESEVLDRINKSIQRIDARYSEITQFNPNEDIGTSSLKISELENLLVGKASMFFYDDFHPH